jgi:outer membrane protein assembly factor BamB
MHCRSTYLFKSISLLVLAIQFSSFSAYTLNQGVENKEDQLELSQPLIIKWFYSSDVTTNLTPTASGERIYLPLAFGILISLNTSDGRIIWKTDIGGELSSSPIADEHSVFVASETGGPRLPTRANGSLRALGREGGITLWMRTLPMPLQGSLVDNGNNLFGGSSDGKVYSIKKRTGDIVWVMQHSASFNSQPTIINSHLYIGSNDGYLFSLDQNTGKILWRYRTQGGVHGRAVVFDGIVYFGSTDGYVYALRETDGALRWRRRTGASVQTVAATHNGLLALSFDNFVYSLSLANGDSLWKRQLAGRIAVEPLTATDGTLFTPLSSTIGVVLDLRDGKLINSLPLGEDNSITAAPIIAGKVLFVTTRHGLIAFSRPS